MKKNNYKKDEFIILRVPKQVKDRLVKEAKAAQVSLSKYVRELMGYEEDKD